MSNNVGKLATMSSIGITESSGLTISPSVNSINSVYSSGGSSICDSGSLVDHEYIITLTNYVKNFREILAKLKRIFNFESDFSSEKKDSLRAQSHDKLDDVLRLLRIILEKYPSIQSTQLLMAAGKLIKQVKDYDYENENDDTTQFFEAIDQLAFVFSNRVSEYLMGDIDANGKNKNKENCKNLVKNLDESLNLTENLTSNEIDNRFLRLPEGIDLALHRAKICSKYAKDVISYIEKRTSLEAENARSMIKLAQSMKSIFKEESFLPFQSTYCSALDQDLENSNNCLTNCSIIFGHKFIESLTARRNEHEKIRKQIYKEWQRELKRSQDAKNNLRKAKMNYFQKQQDYDKINLWVKLAENGIDGSIDQNKIDKKKRLEEEAFLKAQEAEINYGNAIIEANERSQSCEESNKVLLIKIRELMYQFDQTMKAVTVGYFQLQHNLFAPIPVQYQNLCENSRLYEPGSQYAEFVKRLSIFSNKTNSNSPFTFETCEKSLDINEKRLQNVSESESGESGEEARTSPKTGPSAFSSTEELENDNDPNLENETTNKLSKGSYAHRFQKLKTPSRCYECDAYVCFQGIECTRCGQIYHRKCLQNMNNICGNKRLLRRMTTFGVDLKSHGEEIPYIMIKCISEIEKKGKTVKGLYRVSSVKSKVDNLCQCFENGTESIYISDIHPNVIANVLKQYLRQLPEPLLTFKLYPDFIKIAKDYASNAKLNEENPEFAEKIIFELREVVCQLPLIFFRTLSYLCHHLKRIADLKDFNNMPAFNLGIVFGPTLLRTSEGTASANSLLDTVHQTRIVELLITFANEIFGPPPKVEGNDSFEEKEAEGEVFVEKSVDVIDDINCTQATTSNGKTLDFSQLEEQISSSAIYLPSSIDQHSGQQMMATTSNYPDSLSLSTHRPSVQELRRQFFVTSPAPPQFKSLPSAVNFLTSSDQVQISPLSLVTNSTFAVSHPTKIKRSTIVTTNPLNNLTSSQSSGTLKLLNRDDREPKYV